MVGEISHLILKLRIGEIKLIGKAMEFIMERVVSTDELVQYYIVNKGLNMSAGKIAAQVAHVAVIIADDISSINYNYGDSHQEVKRYNDWLLYYNQKKIILGGHQKDLEKLVSQGFHYIKDNGLTEILPNSLTCVGLGVMNKSDAQQYIKRLQLL